MLRDDINHPSFDGSLQAVQAARKIAAAIETGVTDEGFGIGLRAVMDETNKQSKCCREVAQGPWRTSHDGQYKSPSKVYFGWHFSDDSVLLKRSSRARNDSRETMSVMCVVTVTGTDCYLYDEEVATDEDFMAGVDKLIAQQMQ